MPVTIRDIASQLDLSVGTVSRSLRHDPQIHPRTRAQVNEMALRLGYEGRSRAPRHKVENATLGLLVRGTTLAKFERDVNVVRMLQGLMAEADSSRIQLNIQPVDFGRKPRMEEDPTLVPPMIRDHLCQAVLVHGGFDPRDVALMAQRLPVVSINRIYHEAAADAVVGDDFNGVRLLVGRLIDLGHRHLAWVGPDYEASFVDGRQAGFLQACLRGGLNLSEQHFLGKEIYDKQHALSREQLLQAVNAGATAMVCANDAVALRVIEVLGNEGLRVPEDVSITGFDAWQDTGSVRQLTSIDPQFFEIGRTVVRLAVQRMSQSPGPSCTMIVRSVLVPGETTAPPRQ